MSMYIHLRVSYTLEDLKWDKKEFIGMDSNYFLIIF